YNALSYEWGDPDQPSHWIRVNDGYLKVRENLFRFLHTARGKPRAQPGLNEYIWIDAVCINQDDDQEKGHQVQDMQSVYSYAHAVYVWLGTESNANIDSVADKIPVWHRAEQNVRWIPHDVRQTFYRQLLDPTCQTHLAIEDICNNSYWDRMWIIQEILSARGEI
ncbi:heterokaryon incompatibility, partial [Clohesyomyces aquaticus]